ncbi:MAG TPA: hypothetical protein VF627_07345 [Abditibacterium sp.]|jgi:hypothetical protein
MRKKLNWKETTFLAASALLLAVSGVHVFRRPWDAVPVGRFHFNVADAKFRLLPQRSALLTKRLHHQPQVLALGVRQADLIPVQSVVRIDHEGSQPKWWGESTALPLMSLSAVDGQGRGYTIMPGQGTAKFDAARQQYVVTVEWAVPKTPGFTRQGHLLVGIRMNRPLKSANLADIEAPIESQPFNERVKITMPECLR